MTKCKFAIAVINAVKTRPACVTYKELEDKTGVPEGWIKRLVRGVIEEPSSLRLVALYEHLTGKTLKF